MGEEALSEAAGLFSVMLLMHDYCLVADAHMER